MSELQYMYLQYTRQEEVLPLLPKQAWTPDL